MSIVSPKEISRVRQIERIIKSKFNKSDIPDGQDVVRKRLLHYLEQIETATPQDDFASIYQTTIHERFESMDKDELIRRLLWLQLKETIDTYHNAGDLNASHDDRRSNRDSGYVRLFMNVGQKDGINNAQQLVQFVTEATDVEQNIIQRVTVRDLSSFFNVPKEAADFIMTAMAQQKLKGRKVRIEEAEQSRGGGSGSRGGGGYGGRDNRGGSRGGYGGRDRNSGGRDNRGGYGGRDRGSRNSSQSSDNKRYSRKISNRNNNDR